MKQNVVLQALARLAASLIAIFLLAAAPAFAADKANINIIGYSEEGPYFAFEQFGGHDGSGGYFSNIYIVDLSTDKWVGGAPFTVDTIDDADPEDKLLGQVRTEAMAKAKSKLAELKIASPYTILALNGDGEHGDMKTVNFWTPNCCFQDSTEDVKFTLALKTSPIKKPSDDCKEFADYDQPLVDFSLDFTDRSQNKTTTTTIHDDGGVLPKSRGCTLDYGIYAVLAPSDSYITSRVAIVEVWSYGFEGADRRFIVVPIDG
jgi:predicted secreted protein